MQETLLITRALGCFADSRAANHLFYEIAFLINVDVSFVGRAKKVVVVAHDFLISTDQQEGQVVCLARHQRMEFEHLLHVVQIDKLINHAIRITGDIAERRVFRWRLVEIMDRHDRKELIKRPVIRDRAKHGKIRQILGAQEPPQIVKLFRHVLGLLGILVRPFANIPEQDFALRAIFE